MSCEHCTDPDGQPCYPSYGVAPHECFYKIPGAKIGQSRLLPRDQWPDNFTEDPDSPGHGIYWCAHCGEGKPESRVAAATPSPASPAQQLVNIEDKLHALNAEADDFLAHLDRQLAIYGSEPAPATGGELDVEAERREFEAAWRAHYKMPSTMRFADFKDGKYQASAVDDMWVGWQLGRAPSNNSPVGGKDKDQ